VAGRIESTAAMASSRSSASCHRVATLIGPPARTPRTGRVVRALAAVFFFAVFMASLYVCAGPRPINEATTLRWGYGMGYFGNLDCGFPEK
jgi:hypothetical protein